MKALGSLRHKFFNLVRSASDGFSPVVGSLLLLLITFVLIGSVVSSLNPSGSGSNLQSPVANIDLESCEGGLYVGSKAEKVRCEENRIVLMHEGGDSLCLDSISVSISGYGNSFQGIAAHGGFPLSGNLSVLYLDLSSKGKNSTCYVVNNKATLEDGSWDVGERLVLCGQDSAVGTVKSSVKVSVNGNDNTSDNYGFKEGTEITLKIIDSKGKSIIAERKVIVKSPD